MACIHGRSIGFVDIRKKERCNLIKHIPAPLASLKSDKTASILQKKKIASSIGYQL